MKSLQYEQVLNQEGIEFTYLEKLELKAIDVEAGIKNQARLRLPKDDELIEQYILLNKEGSEPPPIVVYKKRNKSQWVPVDGNQRIQAALKSGKRFLSAYQVNNANEGVLYRITTSINNRVNGKRVSTEESLEHAVTLVKKFGYERKEAAKIYGISRYALDNRFQELEVKEVFERRNIENYTNRLNSTTIQALRPFLTLGEDALHIAACMSQRCGFGAEDVNAMKKTVDKARTLDEKRKVLQEYESTTVAQTKRAETRGGKSAGNVLPGKRMYQQLLALHTTLHKYEDGALKRGFSRKEAMKIALEVQDRLTVLFGTGATSNGMHTREKEINQQLEEMVRGA